MTPEEQQQNREAFTRRVSASIEAGTKLKKAMLAKGLTEAKAVCPECGGWLHGRIAGRRNHLHMKCQGCDLNLME